jgi:hypothetical protein
MNTMLRDELASLIAEAAEPDSALRKAASGAMRALDWACSLRPDFTPCRDELAAAIARADRPAATNRSTT